MKNLINTIGNHCIFLAKTNYCKLKFIAKNYYFITLRRYSTNFNSQIFHDNINMIEDKWFEFGWKVSFGLVTKNLLSVVLQLFNQKVISKLKENQFIYVIFKVQMISENDDRPIYRSITKMQRVNQETFFNLLDIFNESWELKNAKWGFQSGEHKTYSITKIIFGYKIIPTEISEKYEIKESNLIRKKEKKVEVFEYVNIYGYKIPATMDYKIWGDVISETDKVIIVNKKDSKAFYLINKQENYNLVFIKVNNVTILEFKDEIITSLTHFKRTIDNKKIFKIKDGKIYFVKKLLNVPKLLKLKTDKKVNYNYVTMDIETMEVKGKLIPYTVCLDIPNFEKKRVKREKLFFYLSDYNNVEEMLVDSIKYLMKRKFDGYKIYFHNFSNFDGIFFLTTLSKLSNNLEPIINDNEIISVLFKFEKRYRLTFRDSYLLLPVNLKDLAKYFKVEDKGIFPIFFLNDRYNKNLNEKEILNYVGPIPEYKYFSGITEEEFNTKFKNKSLVFWKNNKFNGITPEIYKNYCEKYFETNKWNLREESMKYCLNDCVTLSEILKVFINEIFTNFKKNILSYPTLPSLAFTIFRTHFMKEENIPLITGPLYDFIKEGYYGGHVDVYIPFGKDVYRYDVNSLYPSVMENCFMPVGNPITFQGNITKENKDIFGFFKVKVTSPEYLDHPVLLKRYKNNTIAPLGQWFGVYSSVDIELGKTFGYSFEILSGVIFEKALIFKEYVNFFYEMKRKVNIDDPKYLIAKLFLNTLYGRFGMNPNLGKSKIIDKSEYYKIEQKYKIIDVIPLQDNKELIYYENNIKDNDLDRIKTNVSVPIAAMVTSYARKHMSQFKNRFEYNLLYSDTDSIDIDKPLPSIFIGDDLGKMKLEGKYNEATYIAPKVYGLKNDFEEIVRIKGLKQPISYEKLKSLLKKDSNLSIEQIKWFKNIMEGTIETNDQLYSLTITDNKREVIYDDNTFIETLPYYLNQTEDNENNINLTEIDLKSIKDDFEDEIL
jgi:DNA polymerase type B, organellar and viral